ncbi:hypothetical protein Godav_001004, partial [Gossypium davidsonii]|nr:hypothetical protein [Gossypium davidsonii]
PDALACLNEDLKGKFSLRSVRVFIHAVTDVNIAHDRAPLFYSAPTGHMSRWPTEHMILSASSLDVCEPRSWPSLSSCKLDLRPCLALRAGSLALLCELGPQACFVVLSWFASHLIFWPDLSKS